MIINRPKDRKQAYTYLNNAHKLITKTSTDVKQAKRKKLCLYMINRTRLHIDRTNQGYRHEPGLQTNTKQGYRQNHKTHKERHR